MVGWSLEKGACVLHRGTCDVQPGQAPRESSVMADANEQRTEPLRPLLGCEVPAATAHSLGWDAWTRTGAACTG